MKRKGREKGREEKQERKMGMKGNGPP